MRNHFLVVIIFIFFGNPLFSQTKEYRLISKYENADFNYRALKQLDKARTAEARQNAFKPVKGRHTVYVFIATYKGFSFDHTRKAFNDILIVKADAQRKIHDAYQFTLEWAEPPFSFDLYKTSAKNLTLENRLSIVQLQFRRVNYYQKSSRALEDQGLLSLHASGN